MAQQAGSQNLQLPNSEKFSASVLSLPLNPYLMTTDIEKVSTHLQNNYH
jgi:dTDP-4-amino-4,6-dideoxygalactose transaminase